VTGARTTVVVATRNRSGELTRTLAALLALAPQPPVIVLDNASTDDTAVRAGQFPGVRLIRLPRNLGAAARNLGVAFARTPYVAFSDDDSWWAPDALPTAEAVLDVHPEVGLLAAKTVVGPGERDDPVTRLMSASPLGQADDLPGPSVLGFLACSAIVRRHAYLQVGGFSPLLHFGGEEKLLSYDLAARGWKLCYIAEIQAHHHPSNVRPSSYRRLNLEARNNALIAWMRRPVREGVGAAAALLRRTVHDPRAVSAVAGALRRLPWALAERRRLPTGVEDQIRLLEHTGGGEH
jgi:GT2 family glycosyltransferase